MSEPQPVLTQKEMVERVFRLFPQLSQIKCREQQIAEARKIYPELNYASFQKHAQRIDKKRNSANFESVTKKVFLKASEIQYNLDRNKQADLGVFIK